MGEQRFRGAERRLWRWAGVSPTQQRIHLKRNDVTVRIQETGAGPPVLFVHGAVNSGTSWATLASRLPGFRCILLDRPGCGLSDPLRTALDADTIGDHGSSLIVDVLDALELETAHLVATSLGGYIGLSSVAAHPERVDRMVHFGWPVGAPVAHVPLLMRLLSMPGLRNMGGRMPHSRRSVRAMFRQIGLREALDAGLISDEVVDSYLALLRDTDTMRQELRARYISPLRGLDERLVLPATVLGTIRTPVLFLWGEGDPFGDEHVARSVTGLIPGAQLQMIRDAGHAVWMDVPDRAADTLRTFFTADAADGAGAG